MALTQVASGLGGAAGDIYIWDSTATKPIPGAQTALGFEIDTGKTYFYMPAQGQLAKGWYSNEVYSIAPADVAAVTIATHTTALNAGFGNAPGNSDLNGASVAGATTVTLDATTSFFAGEQVVIDPGTATSEVAIIKSISSPKLTFKTALNYAHADEAKVIGGSHFVPKLTGRVEIDVVGFLTGNNTGDVMTAQIAICDVGPNGAVPVANGGTAAGTLVGNVASVTELTGVLAQGFACHATVGANSVATNTAPSGGAALTIGNPYCIDLQLNDNTTDGKTVRPQSVIIRIREI